MPHGPSGERYKPIRQGFAAHFGFLRLDPMHLESSRDLLGQTFRAGLSSPDVISQT